MGTSSDCFSVLVVFCIVILNVDAQGYLQHGLPVLYANIFSMKLVAISFQTLVAKFSAISNE
uniref:Uncharacterized protein n=1 Tax=Arundo donax TaxID=35708 RepID=A0A0A9EEA3_ARUDO